MNSEGKFYSYVWSLVAIVAVVAISNVSYYNIKKDALPLQLAKQGVNIAVARCAEVSWHTTSNYLICSKVFADAGLSKEEAEKLVEGLE